MTAIVKFPASNTREMCMARDVLFNVEYHHVDTVMAAINVLGRSLDNDDHRLILDVCNIIEKRAALDAAIYGRPAPRSWATLDSLLAWVCAGAVAGGVGVLIGRALAAWWLA